MSLRDRVMKGLKLGLKLAVETTDAALQSAATVHTSGVLRGLTPRAVSMMLGSALGGEHTYGILLGWHKQIRDMKPALIRGEQIVTYGQLHDLYHRASQMLDALGVRPGDRIVIMMGNRPEYVIAAAAAGNLGATFIPVPVGLTTRELGYIIDHSRPVVVLTDGERWGVVQDTLATRQDMQVKVLVVAHPDPHFPHQWEEHIQGAPALPLPPPEGRSRVPGVMMYTSGTTGKPKGVERSSNEFDPAALAALGGMLQGFGMSTDDVFYTPCPLYHSAPIFFLSFYLFLGGTIVLGEDSRGSSILEAFRRYGVTNTFLVPTLLTRIAQVSPAPCPGDFPQLRAIYSTAARLPTPLAGEITTRFGDVLHDFYGATETGIVTLAGPMDLKAKPGSVGKVLPGAEVYLLDEQGQEVGSGMTGELYARTSLTMTGYRDDQDATRGASRRGCFTVGDLAVKDEHGYLFIVGRRADMIITGGVNVYPAEIEEVLLTHPGVAEAAVVGIGDEEWGESVHAVLVPRPGMTLLEADLRSFAAQHLAKAKQPRRYHFRETLPTSPQGKVLKRVLRTELAPRP